MKKQSALYTIFLFIVTLGVYMPFWYLKRVEQFKEKFHAHLNVGLLKLTAVYSIFSILLMVALGVYEGYQEALGNHQNIFFVSVIEAFNDVILLILYWGVCFEALKIKRGAESIHHGASLGGVPIFFFGIIYLQIKINKFISEGIIPPLPTTETQQRDE